jgi:hypothetical protein
MMLKLDPSQGGLLVATAFPPSDPPVQQSCDTGISHHS